MGVESKISWTHSTWNPWWGCTKISAGCDHCYAATFSARLGNKLWGPTAPRRIAKPKYWKDPEKWNANAELSGQPHRVFVASMADVCEDREDLLVPRADLMRLIERTPALTWMLLTKRPENFNRFFGNRWGKNWPKNVWAMTTAENQAMADKRVPELLKVPAVVLGISAEPLLGPVTLRPEWMELELQAFGGNGCAFFPRINWVIAGGESGPGARPMHPDWARSLRDQCRAYGVAFHFKQWGQYAPCGPIEKEDGMSGGFAFDAASGGRTSTNMARRPRPGYAMPRYARIDDDVIMERLTTKEDAGRTLDGRTHDEFPKGAECTKV